ncbi:rod shape-determining protein MreC [Lacticaseibacillus jixiensis]|uniref:rod shape-determining protein MreC n=1 Tax=Lacticaseibacillus jixiensis TaxID=3231926 RepID=UPI0036F2FBE2
MNKFFSNKKLIVIMIAILCSLGLISYSVVVRDKRTTPPVFQELGNDVVGIGARIVSSPAQWVKGGLDDIDDLINTYSENKRLKAQIEDLAQTKVEAQTLKVENAALKKQLKLDGTLTDYTQINASVMLRSPTDWRNIVVINKGAGAGVKKNMPVLSGSGVVGRVVEVNNTNAKVEMLSTDNKAADHFAAQITLSSGATINGVITGYQAKTGYLIFGQLNTDKAIKKGQKVVTSGLGGATPKGLLLGTVETIKKDDYGLADTVYLKPAANLDDLSVVTVVARTIASQQ